MNLEKMTKKINNFLRYRKCDIKNFKEFRSSQLYEHIANIFGDLIYTEDKEIDFIAVGKDGIYDEIYYPQDIEGKKGVIIPKLFYESNLKKCTPDPVWKDVANKGYAIIKNIDISKNLIQQVEEEAYIPHGYNPEANLSKSIFHPYFFSHIDYDMPEKHKSPPYMKEITKEAFNFIPQGQPIINSHALFTSDAIKYIFDQSDINSTKGPYSFHADYFNRCLYMFFIYFSKKNPIIGRELLVGKRSDYSNFLVEGMELSSPEQPKVPSPNERVDDSKVPNPDIIKIENNMIVLMNTINPLFVHKVLKLQEKNEVILITNYCWSKYREKLD